MFNYMYIKKKSLFCLIIAFILVIPLFAVNIKLKHELNKFSFDVPQISINKGNFYVVIKKNNKSVQIFPEGEPIVQVENVKTPIGIGKQKNYTWNLSNGYILSCHFTQIGNDILALSGSFTNGTQKPVYLEKFVLFDGQLNVSGKANEWMLNTTDIEVRRVGTLDQDIPSEYELFEEGAAARNYFINRGLFERSKDRMSRCFLNDISLYKVDCMNGITIAAVDTISDVFFDVKINKTNMNIEIQSDMSEVRIDSKETRKSDEVLFISKKWGDAQKIRNKWIQVITDTKINKKPVYGWCSWYRTFINVKPDDINQIVSFINQNKNKIPFEVVQIDDGWQVFRGNWYENSKFEGLLNKLADNIRKSDMMPGIWLSPIRCDKIIGVCNELERPFPSSWYVNFNIGKASSDRLDPTHPEVKEFIIKSLKQCKEKGYTYYKLDFSQVPIGAKRFYNSKMTRFQAQRELFRVFREVIGNESYLLACGISDQRSILPFVDADRIGSDCVPDGGFAKELASDNLPKNIHGFLFPILSMVNKCYENGVLCHGDPDVTYTGMTGKTSPKQLQTFHSFVGIYAGAVFTSDLMYDIRDNKNDHIRMMEILYPITKEKGISFTGGCDFYGKEFGYVVKRTWGNALNVITWNPNHTEKQSLGIKHIPINDIGKRFHIWSFWDEEYKGICSTNYKSSLVDPYEHELLRITPISEYPTVIGSNLHISMGAVEIKNVINQKNSMLISLDPNAGARNGRIYIYSKKKLSMATSTNSRVQLLKKGENLYVIVLTDRKRNVDENITITFGEESTVDWKKIVESNDESFKITGFSEDWKQSW